MVVEKIYRVGNKVQFHRCGDSREIKGRIEKIFTNNTGDAILDGLCRIVINRQVYLIDELEEYWKRKTKTMYSEGGRIKVEKDKGVIILLLQNENF